MGRVRKGRKQEIKKDSVKPRPRSVGANIRIKSEVVWIDAVAKWWVKMILIYSTLNISALSCAYMTLKSEKIIPPFSSKLISMNWGCTYVGYSLRVRWIRQGTMFSMTMEQFFWLRKKSKKDLRDFLRKGSSRQILKNWESTRNKVTRALEAEIRVTAVIWKLEYSGIVELV